MERLAVSPTSVHPDSDADSLQERQGDMTHGKSELTSTISVVLECTNSHICLGDFLCIGWSSKLSLDLWHMGKLCLHPERLQLYPCNFSIGATPVALLFLSLGYSVLMYDVDIRFFTAFTSFALLHCNVWICFCEFLKRPSHDLQLKFYCCVDKLWQRTTGRWSSRCGISVCFT